MSPLKCWAKTLSYGNVLLCPRGSSWSFISNAAEIPGNYASHLCSSKMLQASQFTPLISIFLYMNYHSQLTIKQFVFIPILERQRKKKTLMEKGFFPKNKVYGSTSIHDKHTWTKFMLWKITLLQPVLYLYGFLKLLVMKQFPFF